MPLINCKVELKLKWKKYCVLSANDNDNDDDDDDDDNNITFTIRDAKLYVPVVTLSSKRLRKRFERSVYWNDYKSKSENKNMTNEYRYFLESNFVGVNRSFVSVYSNQDVDFKRFKTQRQYLPKKILDNYNFNISGKNFYDQAVDSDIKQYEEIRKLTAVNWLFIGLRLYQKSL